MIKSSEVWMYKLLQGYLKRPALYERTNSAFWTDPYIAGQMLKAHLDPDSDAASYRHAFIDKAVEWMASLPLPKNTRLLDIGCGPGLYTKQFSERGLHVTGMDFSENSIQYAIEHDSASEYILGDYLTMAFKEAYDIVTFIMCDYGALIPDERRILLNRVHRALMPGGLFLFDVLTPLWSKGRQDNGSWEMTTGNGFWSAKPYICMNANYDYGQAAECRRHVIMDENEVRSYNIWDCFFTVQSLLDEVTPFGFSNEGVFGDITGKPYTDESQRLCVILRKNR